MNAPTRTVASAVGVTEGQAYTLLIGLVIGLVTAAIGIPPTLRDDRVAEAVRRALPGRESASSTPAPDTAAAVPSPPAPAAAPLSSAPFVGAPSAAAFGAIDAPTAASDATPSTDRPAGSSFADGGPFGEVTTLASASLTPHSVAVDAATGAFYVGGVDTLARYSAGGVLERTYAVPDGPTALTDLAVRDGGVFATSRGSAQIIRVDARTGAVTAVTTIPDVPTCVGPVSGTCELSPRNAPPAPTGMTFGPTGDLFVADGGQGIVWRVDAEGKAAVWDRSTEFLSDSDGPAGLRFDGANALVLAVRRSLVAMTGVVYRIPITAAGPGAHEELFRSDPDAQPVGVAVGASGRVYVTLSTSGAVVVLERDGTEAARVASPRLGTPVGLAFRGTSLLVADQKGSVARVSVEDGALTRY